MNEFISFHCPACRKRLKVSRQLLGKRLQCQDCKDIFYLKKVTRQEFIAYESQFSNHDSLKDSSSIERQDTRISAKDDATSTNQESQ